MTYEISVRNSGLKAIVKAGELDSRVQEIMQWGAKVEDIVIVVYAVPTEPL